LIYQGINSNGIPFGSFLFALQFQHAILPQCQKVPGSNSARKLTWGPLPFLLPLNKDDSRVCQGPTKIIRHR